MGTWMERIRQTVEAGGGFLVVLEDYRTETARSLAGELGLHFLDLRRELAACFGPGMAWAAPDSLEPLLRRHLAAPGLLAHDAEVVLGLQHPLDREAWLRTFLETPWPQPLLLTVAPASDVPQGPRTLTVHSTAW